MQDMKIIATYNEDMGKCLYAFDAEIYRRFQWKDRKEFMRFVTTPEQQWPVLTNQQKKSRKHSTVTQREGNEFAFRECRWTEKFEVYHKYRKELIGGQHDNWEVDLGEVCFAYRS